MGAIVGPESGEIRLWKSVHAFCFNSHLCDKKRYWKKRVVEHVCDRNILFYVPVIHALHS